MLLPQFHYRTAAQQQPRSDALNSGSLLWAEEFQLITDDDIRRAAAAAQFGTFGGLTHDPQTPLETLRLISDFFHWLWLVDDLVVDKTASGPEIITPLIDHFVSVVRGETVATSAPERAYVDLARRLVADHGAQSGRRFAAAGVRFLEALIPQSVMRASDTVPTLHEYEILRRGISGVPMAVAFIEPSIGIHMSDAEWQREDVQRLAEQANDIISWVNDIFSLPMELAQEPVFWNYPLILQAQGMTLPEAITETGKRTQQAYDDFWLLAERLMQERSPACRAFIHGLDRWMSGSYEWHIVTPRYWRAWETFIITA